MYRAEEGCQIGPNKVKACFMTFLNLAFALFSNEFSLVSEDCKRSELTFGTFKSTCQFVKCLLELLFDSPLIHIFR